MSLSDEAALDLLEGLVRIPSVSHQEADAVNWLVARMTASGMRAERDAAGNAVGVVGDGPNQIVLLGHIDTVPGNRGQNRPVLVAKYYNPAMPTGSNQRCDQQTRHSPVNVPVRHVEGNRVAKVR